MAQMQAMMAKAGLPPPGKMGPPTAAQAAAAQAAAAGQPAGKVGPTGSPQPVPIPTDGRGQVPLYQGKPVGPVNSPQPVMPLDPRVDLTRPQEAKKTAEFLARHGRGPGSYGRLSTDLDASDDGAYFSRDDAFARNSGG